MSRRAIVLLATALACGPGLTTEQEVEQRRTQYQASLQSLTVKQDPVIGEPAAQTAAAEVPAAPRVRTDAILDIAVTITSQDGEPLPGVTIDIEHFDAARRPKGRTTFWVDASQLAGTESARITHVLENVAWETGDTYAVSVRSPIPPAERADYREFGVSAR